MAFFGAFALVLVLIIRPQEIWPVLNLFRLLDVFTVIAGLGVVIDFSTGKQKNAYSPQLPFLAAFIVSCFASTAVMVGRPALTIVFNRAIVPALGMLVVMYGSRSFPRMRTLLIGLIACMTFVSSVAIHQGYVEPACVELPKDEFGVRSSVEDGIPDGRACDTAFSCERGGKPGAEYACERLGMFATASTGRRVRWRGQLGDPNELSVYIGAVIPLLFAMSGFVNKKAFSLLALAIVGIGLWCVILTQSRGGQLVITTVFGIYFVARFGLKGLIGAVVLAMPVVMLGGREGLDADDSSAERFELLYEGGALVLRHPLIGIGTDQFAEHMGNGLTAHNAYLLAVAELGFPGFFCWSGLLWSSVKIPLTILRRTPAAMDARIRPFAMALLVSFIGLSVGIFFLSFTYKQLLFVWFGIAGALYGIVKKEDPSFVVKFGVKDYLGIALFDIVMFGTIYSYTRLKGI